MKQNPLATFPESRHLHSQSRRYHSLDAMRGLAALFVVAGHYREDYAPSSYLAVDFFFLLSGFVIAQAYGAKLEQGMGFTTFMLARLKRLYPLFIIGIGVGLFQIVALSLLGYREQSTLDLAVSLATNALFLPSPSAFIQGEAMQGLFPINGPAWSMFWEMLINIVFVLFLVRLSSKMLGLLCCIEAVALVLAAIHYGSLNIGWEWTSWFGGFPRVAFSFSLGILFSRVYGTRLNTCAGWLALVPSAILIFCLIVPASGSIRVIYDLFFCVLLGPLIVLAGIFLEVPRGLRSSAQWLGYASYPIYVLHRGVLGLYEPAAGHIGLSGPQGLLVFWLVVVVFGVTIALLLDRFHLKTRQILPRASA